MSTFAAWTVLSLVVSLILGRKLLHPELFGGIAFGISFGALHYFAGRRSRRERQRREQEFRDQQRRPQ